MVRLRVWLLKSDLVMGLRFRVRFEADVRGQMSHICLDNRSLRPFFGRDELRRGGYLLLRAPSPENYIIDGVASPPTVRGRGLFACFLTFEYVLHVRGFTACVCFLLVCSY